MSSEKNILHTFSVTLPYSRMQTSLFFIFPLLDSWLTGSCHFFSLKVSFCLSAEVETKEWNETYNNMSDGKEWMGWKPDTKIRNEGNKFRLNYSKEGAKK